MLLIIGSVVGSAITAIALEQERPLFPLDSNATYTLTQLGENIWISGPGGLERSDAIQVSGSCQDLNPFIGKEIRATGYFTTETGGHSYFLKQVESLNE